MSDQNTGDQTQTANQDKKGAETIAKAEYDKVLADMAKMKKDFDSLKADRDSLTSKLTDIDKKTKESSGDFKSLYEQTKNLLEESQKKYEGLKSSMVVTEKYKAASAALLKAGLNAEAVKLLDKEDFKEMEIEATSQGRFLVHGTELFVDKFKKEYPFAFAKGQPPTMNGGGGKVTTETGDELTTEYMLAIEKKDPKKYKELWPKYVEMKKKERMARATS